MVTKEGMGNLAFIMGILLVLLLIPAAVSASDWEQFQINKYNNGVTSDKAPITYPIGNNISWAKQPITASTGMGAGFDSAFIVVDNVLYVVGYDHVLRALCMVNGTQIWEASTYGGGFQLGSIAAGNGSIFVPTTKGKFFCINMTTGTEEWVADERIPYDNSAGYLVYQLNTPVLYEDHKVYFGAWMGSLGTWCKYHCYYDNGTECWERNSTSGGGYYWSGAVPIDDYLIYGDTAGNLTSVYKSNGTTVDELNLSSEFGVGNSIYSSVCYTEELDRIYFTTTDGYLFSLSVNPNGTFNTTDEQDAKIGMSKSTPSVYNNRLYVGTGSVWGGSGSGLLCFNASNLSEKFWAYENATAIQSSPVVSTAYDNGDGEVYIYFTTNVEAGTVYCINESGIEQWKYTAPSDINEYTLQGVTISDGWLFYGNDNSYVFGLATNESLGITDIPSNGSNDTDVISITSTDSLQDAIYAANDGDTIMMAPGTYNVSLVDGSVDLYINKSDLTFMADGGEVIINPEEGDDSPCLWPGKADANDTTGCDASGLTFKGITFRPFEIDMYYISSILPNANIDEMSFIGCTFTGAITDYYLQNNVSVVNCTFNGGPRIYMGNNSRFEGNTGDGSVYYTYIGTSAGIHFDSGKLGIIVRNNSLVGFNYDCYSESLVENNLFKASDTVIFEGSGTIVRNNEFMNESNIVKLGGDVYLNNFTNCSKVYLGHGNAGNVYLNNLIDCTTIRLYTPGTFNTSSSVSYTYEGQEYTGYLGNYYSSYAGTDNNGDGVGDDSITFKYDTDYYPLMGAWNAAGSEIESEYIPSNNVINITSADSLQEIIYAANDGDTIMMAPGTYNVTLVDGSVDLYINKSDLTFMADGGEVIISPDSGDDYPAILPGLSNASDATGCDASGITFKGITFGAFNQIGTGHPGDLKANQNYSNMKFEDCTFEGVKYCKLHNDSSVLNCTFSDSPQLQVYGDNLRVENNNGTGAQICNGYYRISGTTYYCSNLTVRNNIITDCGINYRGGCLFENNVFDGSSTLYYLVNQDMIIRNNDFLNLTGSTVRLIGQIYQNNFNVSKDSATLVLQSGGTYYLNNFVGFTELQLNSGTYNTSTPVTYTYGSQEHTGYLGNYYSTYAGNDSNSDGVGDESLSSSSGGTDYYPLMGAWIAAYSEISTGEQNPPSLVANFSASPLSGNASLKVQFTDTSTGEGISAWAWDFNNDEIVDSTIQNPSYNYTTPGTYSVKLTVTNAAGSDEELKEDYINVSSASSGESSNVSLNTTILPAISFKVSPSSVEFGELSPGKVSASQNLTLKNSGSCKIKVTAEVTDNLQGDNLYTSGLWLDSALWNSFYKDIESSNQADAAVSLHVPANYTGTGNKQGTITFWVEAVE